MGLSELRELNCLLVCCLQCHSRACRREICSCKFNSVAKFHCQISVTKVSKLSNIK